MSKLQNEDFKTEAQVIAAGGVKAQLLNDTKVYVTANAINKTLDDAIADGDIVTTGGAGIGQIVSTTKSDTFTSASTTFVDITGLSVSVTPATISSKILVLATITGGNSTGADYVMLRLMRDATPIGIADAAGSRPQLSATFQALGSFQIATNGIQYLDSPATTSATTYKVQVRVKSGTATINRNSPDTNNDDGVRTISSITVIEIL